MPEGGVKTRLDTARMLAAFQPGSALFSPGVPPVATWPQPIRRFDLHEGVNLNRTPRVYEAFGFAQLRSFANVELVRLCIETRKDQVERLDWQVRTKINRKPRTDSAERIAKATKLLRKPDGVTVFDTWLRQVMEDVLAIDAATIERRRNRRGDLHALEVVDGSTIKVLVDHNGRLPLAPDPAYQQIIKGTIWNDLTTQDIIYSPRNLRPGHLYGFGPVEQTIVTLNTLIKRQTQQLAYFTEGTVPQGLLSVPDGWTPDQVREWQDWLDSRLAGNLAERAKLVSVPNGTKYQGFKESPIKDEFDEWLARVVCYAFSIPPTPFIKQMNRGTAQEDQDRAMEEGLSPILKWAKRLFDGIIQDDLGFSDLEFVWMSIRDIDIEKQARVHDLYLRNGTYSINDVRDDLGMEQIGPEGDGHYVYVGTGAMPVDRLEDQADAQIEAQKTPPGARPTPGKTVSRPAATSSSPSPKRAKEQTQ
ncbi:MAG TPA: phage portal protein [Xanthobacteraceae bacterium]|nr:phage portal protein [Xanthobacteraceae bacterium]